MRDRARTKRRMRWFIVGVVAIGGSVLAQDRVFSWSIPAPFPRPAVPTDNAMSVGKVELGRRLFYDTRLSVNGKQSCATCHVQALAFTDGKARAIGATGAVHPRGSMSLANSAYNPSLTWANPSMTSLEEQALVPMFGTEPVELGLSGHETDVLRAIAADTLYQRLFTRVYGGASDRYSINTIVSAIAAFERTLISVRSPYDRYRYGGDSIALSASAKRGEAFFFSGQHGSCFQCHGGWNFNGNVTYEGRPDVASSFFNTGLYNVAGATSYPSPNTGVYEFSRRAEDVGKFRVPTLRNVAVTAPYMHDGSIATLGEVLEHYAAGGRVTATGAYAGDGRANVNKAPQVRGFAMSAQDKRDLIAFLESLTDSTFLSNPAFSDPWKGRR